MGSQFDDTNDLNGLNGIISEPPRQLHGVKIGIVGGAGAVGAAATLQLAHSGLASELVIVDIFANKANGVALDVMDAAVFTNPCRVTAGNYDALHGAQIVIITAGFPQKPGETRLDLVSKNFGLFKKIIPQIVEHAPGCILLVATNPVDVLTYVAVKLSGFPASRVIGSGTLLDTARLKLRLGQAFAVSPNSVQTLVIGEHGDSEVAVRSHTTIGGVKAEDLKDMEAIKMVNQCVEEAKNAAYAIIEGKGYTDCAIGASLTTICRALVRDEGVVMPVSILGEYAGVDGVCLSVPHMVGAMGATRIGMISLSDAEYKGLCFSALRIKEVIDTLDFSEI